MDAKKIITRKALTTALVLMITATLAGDPRVELRHRLDSIEVEKQTLKRQGKPIGELESAAAAVKDSLLGLRSHAPERTGPGRADGASASFWDNIPLPESLETFRPRSGFDWVIVCTGFVAIVSLAVLVIGLFIGRKKHREPKKKIVSRKINLAPTGSHPAVTETRIFSPHSDADILPQQGAGVPAGGRLPTAGQLYRFDGRADTREAQHGLPSDDAGNLEDQPFHSDSGPANAARDRTSDIQSLIENLRKAAPPPQEPPPLFSDAPEDPEPPPFAGTSDRKTTTIPSFNELVIAANKNGLSEQEISRRYQLSIDQIKLILKIHGA